MKAAAMSETGKKEPTKEENERRSTLERRRNYEPRIEDKRQDQRRQNCVCGTKMVRTEKEVEGMKGVKFAAYECPKCGRINYIETKPMKMSRMLTARPIIKKLLNLNQSLGVVLPKEITVDFNLRKGQEVEISVEGINKIVIRIKE